MNLNSFLGRLFVGMLLLFGGLLSTVQAQWQTQTIVLKPGWNAVYLHVDASHISLDDSIIVANGPPINEVWRWQPAASTAQFTTTPQQSSLPNSQWAVWDRSATVDSLTHLGGNAGYLVNNTDSVDYTWRVVGKPVAPRYDWTTSGLNFIGFSTPAVTAPKMDAFLAPVPEFQRDAEVYRYPGGALGANNPVRVWSPLFRTTNVRRGEAFWIRAGDSYNRYFGPVSVDVQSGSGVHFGDSRGTYSLRLKNMTATARTMTMDLLASETPPQGQQSITATPPMLVRGALNTTNLTYEHTVLNDQKSFTLAAHGSPGSELEIVLGLNRSAMTAGAGSLYAGILRLADTGGLSQIDLPVSATVANTAGLWVGQANITQVGQYLKTYQRGADGLPVLAPITSDGAAYVSTRTNTGLGVVARPYPLRLILMADARYSESILVTNEVTTIQTNTTDNVVTTSTNTATVVATSFREATNSMLLQRVYFGSGLGTNVLVATREALLDSTRLDSARRISATHLPFSQANAYWSKNSGQFGLGTNLVFNVSVDYKDQASNPFLHTFHPDHDNLNVNFSGAEVQGAESYTVTRVMRLSFTAPTEDFASLTAATGNLGGTYTEVMTFYGRGSNAREFTLSGVFSLNRMSDISTLTTK